jgi:hypothetical protein
MSGWAVMAGGALGAADADADHGARHPTHTTNATINLPLIASPPG